MLHDLYLENATVVAVLPEHRYSMAEMDAIRREYSTTLIYRIAISTLHLIISRIYPVVFAKDCTNS